MAAVRELTAPAAGPAAPCLPRARGTAPGHPASSAQHQGEHGKNVHCNS